jgi:ParB-like chromosome segregation protein Spo0J
MDPKHLHEQLQQLQKEIDVLPVDDENRAKLHALVEDIDRELGCGPQFVLEDASLQGRLEELVSGFEVEHPTVAGILKDIMVKLASIGV